MHGRGARVLRRLRPPLAQPRPAHARPLHQLQRGGPGERLHPLPPHLALLRRPGQQLGRRPPLLGVLDDIEHVEEILVGARHPDVQLLLTHEAVVVRVGGVGGARRHQTDTTATAPHIGADDRGEQAQREQEPQNLHAPIVTGRPGAP